MQSRIDLGGRAGLLALTLLTAWLVIAPVADAARGGLDATVRRTEYGVAHVRADNFKEIGFGFAHALAEDNVCTVAETYVTVAGERSRFFGADGTFRFSGNATVNDNPLSDFFYAGINKSGIVEDLIAAKPPRGPLPRVRKLVRGYVAGYNAYLRETGVGKIRDPRCRGAEWVRPITEIDVYRRFYQLGSLASSGVAIEGIGGAAPVAGARAEEAEATQRSLVDGVDEGTLAELQIPTGSNAYGFGAEATRTGRGMLLGNPHFPWDGAERLWQTHLTIPGKLDAAGGALYGAPFIAIGHNDALAWTHTVATAWRFTPFELRLAPGDPYSYIVDGVAKPMEKHTVTIHVRNSDGTLSTRTGTTYGTDYGPVLTSILGLPIFPWTPERAYALGDANGENFRYLNHFVRTQLAGSVAEYDRIQREVQGIPWVNSIAADRKGNAYYSMDGAVPNVPDGKVSACSAPIGVALAAATGIPVLDGSRSECALGTDPEAAAPGILGPSKLPHLTRRDYVTNGNDSHWLTNPEQPLEGFDRIVGDERTERSLRTRLGLVMVEERLAGTDGLPGKNFTLRNLQQVAIDNRQYAGELWRDELVAFCRANPVVTGTGGPVATAAACPILEQYNLHDDLDSKGAVLFRRFVANAIAGQTVPTGTASSQNAVLDLAMSTPFDVSDPVHTPRGLNTGNPAVGRALADAITDLQRAGIPLDAPLGDWQYDVLGGERIPIHGGPGPLGIFNAITSTWNPQEGYSNIPHGTSFLTAIAFTDGRCPVKARTFVTYGQSENQRSEHASDYSKAFSEKDWNAVPFCGRQLKRKTLEIERLHARR